MLRGENPLGLVAFQRRIEYIKELQKQNKSSKPKTVRDPKVKRISTSDTYKITSLGREFLGLIKPVEIGDS